MKLSTFLFLGCFVVEKLKQVISPMNLSSHTTDASYFPCTSPFLSLDCQQGYLFLVWASYQPLPYLSSLRPARWVGRPRLASSETSILSGWVTLFAFFFYSPCFQILFESLFPLSSETYFSAPLFTPYLFSYFLQMCSGSFRNLHTLLNAPGEETPQQSVDERAFPTTSVYSFHEVGCWITRQRNKMVCVDGLTSLKLFSFIVWSPQGQSTEKERRVCTQGSRVSTFV